MKQTERIMDYIRKFGSISSREAFLDLGVTRLSARIADLKDEGVEFTDEWESSKNRFGETVTYKRFSLKGADK